MRRRLAAAFVILFVPVAGGSLDGRFTNHPYTAPEGGALQRRTDDLPDRTAASDLRLWYRQPAANWNEALPIGNGRLGAMVFGGVADERLQLNEDTIWAGEKRDRLNPAGPAAVTEVRRLLADGKAVEAEALADKAIIATPRRMPPYQPRGFIRRGSEDSIPWSVHRDIPRNP